MTPSSPDAIPALAEGIALFNQGAYYACHDVLEAIWMESDPPSKPFYQGILQIAVGLYHLSNHNWQGAAVLLGEGVNRLRAFEPQYQGIDVESLVDCGWSWLLALQETGPEGVRYLTQGLKQAQTVSANAPVFQPPLTTEVIIGTTAITLPIPYIQHNYTPR